MSTASAQQKVSPQPKQSSLKKEEKHDTDSSSGDKWKVHVPMTVERLTAQPTQPNRGLIRKLSWNLLPDAPTEIWAGSSAVIGNRVFIKAADSEVIHAFDPEDRLLSVPAKPPIKDFTIVNVVNLLTTVGGQVDGGYSDKLYSYVYATATWVEGLPKMPTARSKPGAVYTNNTLVVAGGFNGEHLSTVEILNTTSRQWSSVCSLPLGTSQPSMCIVDDFIYIHPGHTLYPSSLANFSVFICTIKALEKCKARFGLWKEITALPVQKSALTSVNGHLIAVGGENRSYEPTDNVYQYNEASKLWTIASRMSVARHYCLTALLPDNKLMVVGGYNFEAEESIEIATMT